MQPIVTPEEMAAIDAAAPEPVEVLIERAGAAVARAALDLLGGAYGRRVVVIAGKGNNGADGRAAARRLEARGVRCTVLDAAALPDVLLRCDLVVDAAYGTGFRGEFLAPALADDATAVLAVDIPSGVSGLTGALSGSALAADVTVTFAALKPGLLLGDGPDLAGEVRVADIGLDVTGARAHLVQPADVASWLPVRERDVHKWRTATWIVGGSPGMAGAPRLAAAAALRAGAGYVRLSVPGGGTEGGAPIEAVGVALPKAGWAAEVLAGLDRFRALAVGPGIGTTPQAAAEVRALVAGAAVPTVVDGDGLRALGTSAAGIIGARPAQHDVVLTPHDGELEALTGGPPGADRFAAVRAVAEQTGAVVLLKGPTTLVAHPDGQVLAATEGDARLATAGSGDVLTGTIAALLAQGLGPLHAAAAGAVLHGLAGQLGWSRGLVAGDLAELLPAALEAAAALEG
ncbi:MAG: NAD(P)H-hydrate dehydratase [Acidimicrobiales bacterium]